MVRRPNIMLYNINHLSLHCVFHGIRFKVNKDWLSGIDSLLFYIPPYKHFFHSSLFPLSDKIPTFARFHYRLRGLTQIISNIISDIIV